MLQATQALNEEPVSNKSAPATVHSPGGSPGLVGEFQHPMRQKQWSKTSYDALMDAHDQPLNSANCLAHTPTYEEKQVPSLLAPEEVGSKPSTNPHAST